MNDNPMSTPTPTKTKAETAIPSHAEARMLIRQYININLLKQCPDRDALLAYIDAQEQESRRLDWLEKRAAKGPITIHSCLPIPGVYITAEDGKEISDFDKIHSSLGEAIDAAIQAEKEGK